MDGDGRLREEVAGLSADTPSARQGAGRPLTHAGQPSGAEGALYALDEDTGRVRGRVGVGSVTRFAMPALPGGLALVPTETGVSAVAVR